MTGSFDPQSVLGKRVHFEILLDWDLEIPGGIMRTILPATMTKGQIHYLVDLDSAITFEPHRRGLLLRRRPKVTVGQVILMMRHPEEIVEELHGKVTGEFSAPLLYGLLGQVTMLEYPDRRGNLESIGPVRVRLVE